MGLFDFVSDIPVVGDIVNGVGDAASGLFKSAAGNTDFRSQAGQVPFSADPATVAEFQKRKSLYDQQVSGALGPQAQALAQAMGPPDPRAIQLELNRSRVEQSASAYNPLIQSLSDASMGKGPSAAMDTYRTAAGQAINTNFGAAASGNVAPGQRAALLAQATRNATDQSMQAARDAAVLRANEMNAARGQLGQTIGQRTSALGSLYQGDLTREGANLDSFNQSQQTNAGIEQSNARNRGELTRGLLGAGAKMVGAAGAG